jgi:predicted enzyme related to lactoylglutathione lyase
MPRVVHFQISADQPERASKFYSTVFGSEIKKITANGVKLVMPKTAVPTVGYFAYC